MNNPPAFPNVSIRTKEGIEVYGDSGMSLRDYFAAKAMEAFISGWIERNIYPPNDLDVAEHAYAMADAMLKAREIINQPKENHA
jgi:hypothetical protein